MSPFVSLYLAPVVSQPGRLSRLSGVEGFICLPLSPFICLPLSPSLDAWHGSLGGRVHLSPFVSLHLSPVASQPGCLARLSGWTGSFVSLCLPSFVWHGSLNFVSLHLFPVVSQPGCLARLSRRTDSFVSLCLPSFVSCLWVDSFTCLPLSPFIWLPLSPSLDVCHGSPGGRIHLSPLVPLHLSPISVGGRIDLSPFVSLYLSPVVSQPGCLSGWTDSFVSLCLPLFVSHCLPAWMPLWVDGFICLPLSPSLDVWHSRSAVSFTSRGSVLLAGSGLPSASALASVIPCLVDVGDRVLCLPFIWTSILLGLVGRLPCLSLATPCLFVQCLVISCGLSLSLLAFGVPS